MIVKITPSHISGTINAPVSKSSMQRACAAALLFNGETLILNRGNSNDDLAALDIIQKLGAKIIKKSDDQLLIMGRPGSVGNDFSGTINCGESGLSLRMFTPIAAMSSQEIVVTGSGSLLRRPMNFFDEIFPLLNINIQSNKGLLPIKMKGPLLPADIIIDGSLSSQFLTGLLFAFAVSCTMPTSIKVDNLKSRPYIDLTLSIMEHFGWKIEHNDYQEFRFKPGTHNTNIMKTITYTVESDWSNTAFLLVAGAICGIVKVDGLSMQSSQGDKAILQVLELAGANMIINKNKISVSANKLNSFQFDATHCPDLFPPLVALASYCRGISIIKGVSRLTHKESNRAITLQREFEKMGIKIELQDDEMIISGGQQVRGAPVHSNNDHRIAMACSVAALGAEGITTIEHAEAVEKSYPGFYDHLQNLRANLQKT